MDDTRRRRLKESHCGVDRKLQKDSLYDDDARLLHHRNKHRRKEFNASLVAADWWLYCTQQPGVFWCKSLGLCRVGWWVIVRGVVALVRVFAFAMYRVGLAAPQLNWVETWNNLELAIFTGTRRATFSLCLSRGIGSLIKIML